MFPNFEKLWTHSKLLLVLLKHPKLKLEVIGLKFCSIGIFGGCCIRWTLLWTLCPSAWRFGSCLLVSTGSSMCAGLTLLLACLGSVSSCLWSPSYASLFLGHYYVPLSSSKWNLYIYNQKSLKNKNVFETEKYKLKDNYHLFLKEYYKI